jgi:hypothetical protein
MDTDFALLAGPVLYGNKYVFTTVCDIDSAT